MKLDYLWRHKQIFEKRYPYHVNRYELVWRYFEGLMDNPGTREERKRIIASMKKRWDNIRVNDVFKMLNEVESLGGRALIYDGEGGIWHVTVKRKTSAHKKTANKK